MSRIASPSRWLGVMMLALSMLFMGCEQDHNSSGALNNSEASSDSGSYTPLTAGGQTNSPDSTSKNVEEGFDASAFLVTHEVGKIVVITQMPEITAISGGTNPVPAIIVTNPTPFVIDDSIWSNYWQMFPADQTGDSGAINYGGAIMTTP